MLQVVLETDVLHVIRCMFGDSSILSYSHVVMDNISLCASSFSSFMCNHVHRASLLSLDWFLGSFNRMVFIMYSWDRFRKFLPTLWRFVFVNR